MEIGTIFLGALAAGAEPGTWRLAASGVSAFDTSDPCVAAAVPMLLVATVAVWNSDEPDAAFGRKRCGLVISTGWTSPCAMITRVPRFVRCQSRTAKSFFKRMQPCDAGCSGTTPACNAIPDQVMRCM